MSYEDLSYRLTFDVQGGLKSGTIFRTL